MIKYFTNNIQTASEIRFYENGKVHFESNYLNGNKEGLEIEFFNNGNIKSSRNYSSNYIEGEELGYYEDGNLSFKRNYSNNIPFGEEIGYYGTGEILYERTYLDSNYSEIGYSKNGCKLYQKESMEGINNFKQKKPILMDKLFIGLFLNHFRHLRRTTQHFNCGLDETRTRDPLRDRQVF